jgi:hypothetical protein
MRVQLQIRIFADEDSVINSHALACSRGNRQANAALYRVVIVRMRSHQPTLDYVRRRTAEGKGKREIIRCLKRFVAREIFGYLCRPSEGISGLMYQPPPQDGWMTKAT